MRRTHQQADEHSYLMTIARAGVVISLSPHPLNTSLWLYLSEIDFAFFNKKYLQLSYEEPYSLTGKKYLFTFSISLSP